MVKRCEPLGLKGPGSFVKATEYLLILSCSKRKIRTSEKKPAIEVYDGPMYRAVRKHFKSLSTLPVDICIISAKYGLIRARNRIEHYDREMTPQRALEIQKTVVAIVKKILQEKKYKEIFVNLGGVYRIAIDGIEMAIPDDTQLLFASGGIGDRTSQTIRWLKQASSRKSEKTIVEK